jgi:hypothetical protein
VSPTARGPPEPPPWAVGVVGGIVGGIKGFLSGRRDKKDAAEASKILGTNVSKDAIKQIKEEAKQQGKDWREYLKERKAADEKARAVEARQKLERGLGTAKQGAESLMDRLAAGGLSAGLTDALQKIIGKVGEALLRNGLGILDSRLKESEQFQGAQGAAVDIAQVLTGMREAGLIDEGLLAAGGAAAGELQKQATAAALEKGLSPEDAARAGSAAIAPLLREQLNASVQSGKELDETTKQLLEEAKANGIEILADPAIESLDVQRKQLDVLHDIARQGISGGGEGAIHAAKGLGPVKMPNMGGGLGPLIQTHPDELALILPAHMARRGGLMHAAKGVFDDVEDRRGGGWSGPGTGGGGTGDATTPTGGEGAAAELAEAISELAQAQPIQINAPTTVQIVDQSVVKTVEGQRAFGRHVVSEVERALDQAHAGLESRITKIVDRRIRSG